MRFLKNKIAQAKAIAELNMKKKASGKTKASSSIRKRIPGQTSTPAASLETKNIVKNYGKAICTFSASPVAFPYLLDFCKKEEVEWNEFVGFVQNAKGTIGGLQHFRSLLLPGQNESKQTSTFKRIFRQLSEVFIKYFSVNWIFHSKILYKESHLKFRFKMLRRIQSPEFFFSLKY